MAGAAWLLGGIAGLLSQPLGVALGYAAVVSLLMGLLNLLPIFPMDGGWILRALVWRLSGDRGYATDVAVNTARLAGYVAMLAGTFVVVQGALVVGAWLVGAGILGASAAGAEREAQKEQTAMDVTPGQLQHSGLLARVIARADWVLHGLHEEPPINR